MDEPGKQLSLSGITEFLTIDPLDWPVRTPGLKSLERLAQKWVDSLSKCGARVEDLDCSWLSCCVSVAAEWFLRS